MSITATINALMAHAESAAQLGNTAEADTYQAKAIQLMTDHAIDQAMLAQARPHVRRQIETITITGDELPATYQSDHANGIQKLADVLGGYGLRFHCRRSTRITRVVVAIDSPHAFRRLALGLARIASMEAALVPGDRLTHMSWITGFYEGCRREARTAIQADERAADTSKALVATSAAAKQAVVTGDVTVVNKRAKQVNDAYYDGTVAGRDAYRSFGHQIAA